MLRPHPPVVLLLLVLLVGCADARRVQPDAGVGEDEGEGEGTEGEGEGTEGEGENEGKEGEGEELPSILLAPTEIDFGYVAQGNAVARLVTVTNSGLGILQATRVELSPVSSQDFRLSEVPDPLPALGSGQSFTFRVHYLPSDAVADEGAVFVHSNDPQRVQAGVLLRARKKEGPSNLDVQPRELDFGRVGVEGSSRLEIVCRNSGGMPFQVTGVALTPGSGSGFAVEDPDLVPFTLGPGEARALGVLFAPRVPGHQQGVLDVLSDALAVDRVEVALHGEGLEAGQPCIRVSPAQLAFGAIHRGESKTLSFIIVSCGVAPLRVTGVDRGQFFGTPLTDEFQIAPLPFPLLLQPREQASVEITYTPGVAGNDVGFVEVVNDSPTPRARVDLSASGLQPRLEDVSLHVRLEWNSDDCDVDLHLVQPGGDFFDCTDDCHWQSTNPDWGVRGAWEDDPFLDVDDVDGYGPENINLQTPAAGRYKLVIHYYADYYHGGDQATPSVATDATVTVYNQGNLMGQWTQRLDRSDRTWDVAWVEYPAGTVTPIGTTYLFDRSNIQACFNF